MRTVALQLIGWSGTLIVAALSAIKPFRAQLAQQVNDNLPMIFHRVRYVMVFALLVSASSCKKDDALSDQSTETVPGTLVGSWRATSATVNGNPASLAVALRWESRVITAVTDMRSSGGYGYVECDSGGSVVHNAAGVVSCNGASMIITILTRDNTTLIIPQTLTGTWATSGTQLTLTYYDDPNTITVTSTRIP